jgi:hypothetical protein
MESVTERKGVLRHLRLDRIVSGLLSGEQNFGQDDSSSADARDGQTNRDDVEGARSPEADPGRLLTPEERILELVGEHGGRMRQGEIVSGVAWSESTVSRKLQRLESTGEVTRYQLGREKIVYLPGEEPASFGSPFAGTDEESAPLVH